MTGTNKTEADKTEADKTEADKAGIGGIEPDKIESHYRQQLSALMDGALPPDEARFLLRRLQHDSELAQCVDRWHMAGDALRGEAQAIVPRGFSERIAAAIASEPASVPAATTSIANRGGLRWAGGAALAASVALVALFVTRQPSSPDALETSSSVTAQVSTPSSTTVAAATEVSAVPVAAPALATQSVATASLPRRNTVQRNTRSQAQRAAIRTAARSERPLVAAAAPQGDASSGNNGFGTAAAGVSRPWPSAVLPQTPAAGSFTVGYGSASSPSFYPFEPRLPESQRASGETSPADDAAPSP